MITRVRLVNFKCFADQTIPFGGVTLLAGVNGTGKSSVLQALLVLRQSHLQGLLRANRFGLNGDLVRLGTAADTLNDLASDESIVIELGLGTSTARWRVGYEKGAEVLRGDPSEPIPSAALEENLFTDRFQYLSAERVGPRTFFPASEPSLRKAALGSAGEYTAQFLAAYGSRPVPDLPSLRRASAASHLLRDQVEAWLSEISPGVRLTTTAHPALDVYQLGFAFERERDVSASFRPTNVGFGLTYTLPVLVALLSAEKGSLIMIENPEAHLHPRGQVVMGELIARAAGAGIQVVVETHSDHVLNGLRIAALRGLVDPAMVRIHFFVRSVSGTNELISPRLDRRGRIDKWPPDFFDQWDRSLEELLQAGESTT